MHLNLDDAWPADAMGLPCVDLRDIGPSLRYLTGHVDIEIFDQRIGTNPAPFVLYGSGDFHHLTTVLLRRVAKPVNVICFDNHPDWDIRPPKWTCGGWTRRALELGNVKRVTVWGCGNFELKMPARLFANRAGLESGRLLVRPWAERMPNAVRKRFPAVSRQDWREQFTAALDDEPVYVTIDLDCLSADQAVTNWENGLFTADDIAWALGQLHSRTRIVGGDICGAVSTPKYARWTQRFAGWWDHPKLKAVDPAESRRINLASLQTTWKALVPVGS